MFVDDRTAPEIGIPTTTLPTKRCNSAQGLSRFAGSGLPTVSKQFIDTATNTQIASNALVIANGVRRSDRNVYRCGMEQYPARRLSLPAHPIPIYVRCWVLQQSVCELARVRLSDNCGWRHPRSDRASVKSHTQIKLQTLQGERAENRMSTDLLWRVSIILWYYCILTFTWQHNCQGDLHYHLSPYAEKTWYISVGIIRDNMK